MGRVVVDVMPKPEILDPQGKAVAGALARLGFTEFAGARQGKRFELEVEGEVTPEVLERAREAASRSCRTRSSRTWSASSRPEPEPSRSAPLRPTAQLWATRLRAGGGRMVGVRTSMRARAAWAAGVVVLGAVTAVLAAVQPASASGSVSLFDDDAGGALFTGSLLAPGRTQTSCVSVDATGADPADTVVLAADSL